MKKIISFVAAAAFILNIFGSSYLLAANPGAGIRFALRAPVENERMIEGIK